MVWIVDGANVVGARPDGWWRDRRAAAERLRDHLAARGLPGATRLVLVLEGTARGVGAVADVAIVEAPGSGDDTIVEVVRAAEGPVTVVTADRGLRARVQALGAQVAGPSVVWGPARRT